VDVDLIPMIYDGFYGGMADMAMKILFEEMKEISVITGPYITELNTVGEALNMLDGCYMNGQNLTYLRR
jgi:hypothetical protein